MAHARRERQRQLALDVRFTIWTQDKFDVEQFVKRGSVAVYKSYPLPDTPAMRQARADLEAERKLVAERMKQHGQQG
jgi:cytochrome c551/c552